MNNEPNYCLTGAEAYLCYRNRGIEPNKADRLAMRYMRWNSIYLGRKLRPLSPAEKTRMYERQSKDKMFND